MQFSGFIEASGNATSTEEVFQLLGSTVLPFGCSRIAFFALTEEAQRALAPCAGEIAFILASNYPEEYLRTYVQLRHYEIDPVLCLAHESLIPMVYDDVISGITLTDEQGALVSNRLAAGIFSEIVCPIHGPKDQTFALCFTRDQRGEHDRCVISALQVISLHFFYSYVRAYQTLAATHPPAPPAPSPPPPAAGLADNSLMPLTDVRDLTQRERECLLWTARGKSASTISVILHLSENTINFYVKNAMRKLGTTNRVVAVVLAVRAGLIQP
ncbi:MAG: LuxR C-terminal-related transcriptional regulator [Rhodospirillales bacterium]